MAIVQRLGLGRGKLLFGLILVLAALAVAFAAWAAKGPARATAKPLMGAQVLVFSKTAGFRHDSIPTGQAALKDLAQKQGFSVTVTEDASVFTDDNLKTYDAVVFLNTTGDILDENQQAAFEHFIQSGGGLLGIHSATDTESDGKWPWYTKLIGGHFKHHPAIQEARLVVADPHNPAIAADPALVKKGELRFTDEWYDYRDVSPFLHHILKIDSQSYQGSQSQGISNMVWSNDFDGGRGFYIGLGHRNESYAEPIMQRLIIQGLTYAVGNKAKDYSKVRPAAERMTRETVVSNMNEPIAFDFLPDRSILIIQRGGELIHVDPTWGTRRTVGKVAFDSSNGEHGAYALAVDPGFAGNRILYIQHSKRGKGGKMMNRVGRFRLDVKAGRLTPVDTLIDIPIEDTCCHTGSGLLFNKAGELFITTGDNTNPWDKDVNGFAPLDNRPTGGDMDAGRSSGNTQDLRGKILRIRPKPAGGYTVPKGNLFASPKQGRPEIYAMGFRNPYSLAQDPKTGYLYLGDVGPDSSVDDENRGVRGHDEINEIKSPGNYGWPLFIGNNYPYHKHDFVTGANGPAFDPAHPVNPSARNTGMKVLPPARPALLYYPYNESSIFPELGTGGRSATAGGVYRRLKTPATTNLPVWYEGKLFISDFVRSYVKVVDFDNQGNVRQIVDLAPNVKIDNPIDMMFGPDGNLYVLAYGPKWNAPNPTSGLYRIVFRPGELEPVAVAVAEAPVSPALALLEDNSCLSCHQIDEDSVGPSYKKVAAKYHDRADAVDYVAGRIGAGSTGVWGGTHAMPAFEGISEDDRKVLATYILAQ
ncbi:ThuA domain-containing protein [Asticcacaulis sp. AC460]|uniref:ThuA domain-containing protein n=1 Tax=Asticcacaulis sp. AC460 TaxID=1282360 RepID=UPI000402D1E4|nr:ThuA domain-containing protein [Asticcacaulis sp. AC460]